MHLVGEVKPYKLWPAQMAKPSINKTNFAKQKKTKQL